MPGCAWRPASSTASATSTLPTPTRRCRAHRVLGHDDEATAHARDARIAAADVADDEDRDQVLADLADLD